MVPLQGLGNDPATGLPAGQALSFEGAVDGRPGCGIRIGRARRPGHGALHGKAAAEAQREAGRHQEADREGAHAGLGFPVMMAATGRPAMTPAITPVFDTHCHLQDPRYGAGLGAVLARAREAGVGHFLCCGTRESDWAAVLALAAREGGMIPALGLHPWFVAEAEPGWAERLAALLEAHPGAALGECGLDFALESFDADAQVGALRLQLQIAKRLNRPLSMHCRKAWEALAAAIRAEGLPEAGGAVHAFSGSAELAREFQALGLHLGFGCSLGNPQNRRAPKALRAVAPERLLLETDSPDIPPRNLPDWVEGALNEPLNLGWVLAWAAEIRGETTETLKAQVDANAHRIFGGWARRGILEG